MKNKILIGLLVVGIVLISGYFLIKQPIKEEYITYGGRCPPGTVGCAYMTVEGIVISDVTKTDNRYNFQFKVTKYFVSPEYENQIFNVYCFSEIGEIVKGDKLQLAVPSDIEKSGVICEKRLE
jgi:hypothetical protein